MRRSAAAPWSTSIRPAAAGLHGKLPDLDRLYALFAQIETPIKFDAIDVQPVDLICVLLASQTAGADHLKALAIVPAARSCGLQNVTKQPAPFRFRETITAYASPELCGVSADVGFWADYVRFTTSSGRSPQARETLCFDPKETLSYPATR